MRDAAYADDAPNVTACYRSFERAVLLHLKAEEEEILPAYAEYAPAEASAIRATHDELRAQLLEIGVDVELHCVRAEAIEQMVAMLRAHAAHEERGMYAWADAHLPLDTKRELFTRIARSIRALVGDRKPAAPSHAATHE